MFQTSSDPQVTQAFSKNLSNSVKRTIALSLLTGYSDWLWHWRRAISIVFFVLEESLPFNLFFFILLFK